MGGQNDVVAILRNLTPKPQPTARYEFLTTQRELYSSSYIINLRSIIRTTGVAFILWACIEYYFLELLIKLINVEAREAGDEILRINAME